MADSNADEIARNIAIIYFSVYGFVFLISSIWSAYEVEEKYRLIRINSVDSNKDVQNQIELNVVTTSTKSTSTASDLQKEIQYQSCSKRTRKFLVYWLKTLWKKKSIYISIIPHLFDQATDLGVIYKYYEIWQRPEQFPKENAAIEIQYIFFASIFVIILHKVISCGAIYALTRKCTNVFLQFLDLMMVKAIYLNYKFATDEPGNAQRYLQILEATFESAPQILIAVLFIVKTETADALVLISTISSLWTLTSRVTSDDKQLLKDDWKKIDFNIKKCPFCLNHRYLFRVICWRFCEITSRVFLLVLIWIVIGGFALIIIMAVELLCAFILCFMGEGVIILGNMMYFTATAVDAVPYALLVIAKMYKLFSIFVYLLIVTIFIHIKIDPWKVPDYPERHKTVEDALPFFIFIYTWIASVVWVASFYIVFERGFMDETSSGRDLQQMFLAERWDDLLNLIGFGADMQPLFSLKVASNNGGLNIYEKLICDCVDDDVSDIATITLFKQLFEIDELTAIDISMSPDFGSQSTAFHWAAMHSLTLLKYLIKKAKKHQYHEDYEIKRYLRYDNNRNTDSVVSDPDEFDINMIKDGSAKSRPVLVAAVKGNKRKIVEFLIDECGCNVNDIGDGISESNNAIMIKYLVEEKGLIIPDKALDLIVRSDKLNLVKYLLKEREMEWNNRSIIEAKIKRNNFNTIKTLVDCGVEFKQSDITLAKDGQDQTRKQIERALQMH